MKVSTTALLSVTLTLVLPALARADAAPASVIHYSFDGNDQESEIWRVYDYGGDGQAGGRNIFYPVDWVATGGVNDSGYVWADDTRWRIDTPEKPVSILALILYQNWHMPRPAGKPGTYPRGFGQGTRDGYGPPQLDVRNARLSVHLRGDNLNLKGSRVYFWIVTPQGYRWHFYGQPIAVSADCWGPPTELVLKNDPKLWHLSFHGNDPEPDLESCLKHVVSYGFAFVGFSAEVTGKLSLDEFRLELAGN
jgi:hypothetical protein